MIRVRLIQHQRLETQLVRNDSSLEVVMTLSDLQVRGIDEERLNRVVPGQCTKEKVEVKYREQLEDHVLAVPSKTRPKYHSTTVHLLIKVYQIDRRMYFYMK